MRVLAFALVILPSLLLAAQEKTPEPKTEENKTMQPTRAEQDIIDRTNAERKKAGKQPLTADPTLMTIARAHAANMAKQSKLDHVLDGKGPADRAKDAGYNYAWVAENVGWNAPTAADAITGWINSKGHRENMLSDEPVQIGVAVAKNSRGEPYWVQVFGKRLGK